MVGVIALAANPSLPRLLRATYGDKDDLSGSQWWTVLAVLAILAVVFGLVLLPAWVGRARRHPYAHHLLPVAFFWGLLASWSGISFTLDQMKWSKERASSIASGYYDPRSKAGAPEKPIKTWWGVGVAYAALLGYSCLSGRSPGSGPAAPRPPSSPESGPSLSGGPEGGRVARP